MIRWKYVTILLVILLAVFGLSFYSYHYARDNINLGLDLSGGIYVLLEAEDVAGEDDDDAIERAKTIIRSRVDELGVSEPVVQQEGANRIRVELAGAGIDRERAMDVIGRTAQLEFYGPDLYRQIDVTEDEQIDLENKDVSPFVTGEHVEDAGVGYTPQGQPYVNVHFTSQGADRMREATQEHMRDHLVIVLDGELVSAPEIRDVIHDQGMIDGMGSVEEAQNVALMLRSGALPVSLTELETRTLGPSLGEEFQEQSLQAGLLGLALLVIFMLGVYRLPGLMANIALAVYLVIIFNALIYLDATFTLPGIAGLILSLGMAVDANVIIFERIKEELNYGKTLRVSVESGFKKGIRTILDANITTLIAAAVLFYFGSGPIRGFAVTLSTGIIASMITAVLFTRVILKLLVSSRLIRDTKYFGIQRG
ncbi:protein translocase subunit SecD [Natranaerobius thermophilus]|uniref:Protein translocase subunit SecD n=1 Tax=Natranaerobius thermophilus (strain ATCC BAA-1301 / DSM 18059 / JW/NM-WN-LF) TaxID=457570 RepID=B2A263_NATTJ|nr:protein translocase subunit SecD [Natranaerobius thermophilus]ACB84868.1 protein-export membrane protein SecD [Natranaerobius thermophilus JW/NM-WN-LF]